MRRRFADIHRSRTLGDSSETENTENVTKISRFYLMVMSDSEKPKTTDWKCKNRKDILMDTIGEFGVQVWNLKGFMSETWYTLFLRD
jgi:hypothetical protein